MLFRSGRLATTLCVCGEPASVLNRDGGPPPGLSGSIVNATKIAATGTVPLFVVVIEASEKSGSLITAGCALDQGRDVMAVPGNVLTGRNKGGHALIRDGAKIVECGDDILAELGLGPTKARTPHRGGNDGGGATSVDPLLRRMDVGHAYDLDALAATAGLDIPRLLPKIVELELAGRVRRVDGGRFMRSA